MGETELVLDGMTVEEVMRVVGALDTSERTSTRNPRAGERSVPTDDRGLGDWRAALRAAERETESRFAPPERGRVPEEEIPELPRPVARDTTERRTVGHRGAEGESFPANADYAGTTGGLAPTGLVVGGEGRELFGGPFADLTSVDEIAGAVARCERCVLHASALNPVPGEGNPGAELVCVGEAPGATEDETGRPFVGPAGQLLTKILAAINLDRESVFICNVLKHRPPGNRNPRPEEVEACSPYLLRQLEVIRPSAVLALGTFAAQTLLNTKLSIGKLRGAIHMYHGVPLVVTYHPAALLRNPAWKRPTWEDVQLVRRILDRSRRNP